MKNQEGEEKKLKFNDCDRIRSDGSSQMIGTMLLVLFANASYLEPF